MRLIGPEAIHKGHSFGSFDCYERGMNEWLKRHALQPQASGSARTFVLTEDGQVIGYYSLTVGEVATLEVPERFRKGMRQPYPCCDPRPTCRVSQLSGAGCGERSSPGRYWSHTMDCRTGRHTGLLTHPLDERHLNSTSVSDLFLHLFAKTSFFFCSRTPASSFHLFKEKAVKSQFVSHSGDKALNAGAQAPYGPLLFYFLRLHFYHFLLDLTMQKGRTAFSDLPNTKRVDFMTIEV